MNALPTKVFLFLLLLAASHCSCAEEKRRQVVEIALPDLSNVEQAVADQLAEGRLYVQQVSTDPESSNQLKAFALGSLAVCRI